MIHTSPTELSEGFDDFLNNDSPRYSDDQIQNTPLQNTKQVNGFTPIPMSTPQSNTLKKKSLNKGFMAIPMDESPQKVTPPPKPKSLGSRLLRKNTIDKAIDTASMLTADTSLLGGPSVIQKAPSKQKQQFHPIDELDDGVSGIDGFQGNAPPVSEIQSSLNPFSIPPIPKKIPLSQSNSSNHSSALSSNQPLSGAESFQLFTQLPPIPLPPSNQNPLSAMKKNEISPSTNSHETQATNKVQFVPISQEKFTNQPQKPNQQIGLHSNYNNINYQHQRQHQINEMNIINENNNNFTFEEEEDNNNRLIQSQSSLPHNNIYSRFPNQNIDSNQEMFILQQNNHQNTFDQNANQIVYQNNNLQNTNIQNQETVYTQPQNLESIFNQNNQNNFTQANQEFQQQYFPNQQMQKLNNQQFQQKSIPDNFFQAQPIISQSTPYQFHLSTNTSSHNPYQTLFYGPLGSLELSFIYTFNRSASTLKRLFTGEFNNLIRQQIQNPTPFDSIDIDEFTNSITSEISQIIEAPIQNSEFNHPGISRRISTAIDEETKLMTIGLREVDAKNSTAMENQVNELKKLQIELESLHKTVKSNTDDILREFEKERSDMISMREFNQSFLNELERRSRSIQIKQVELSSKATHQNVEKESIDRMMKQLNQKRQGFDRFIPERGATYNELISSEINKIKQIIRPSIIDNNDDLEYQNNSLSSHSIIFNNGFDINSVTDEYIRLLQDELENQKNEYMSLQMSNKFFFTQPQNLIMQNGFSSMNQTSFQPTSINNTELIRKKKSSNI